MNPVSDTTADVKAGIKHPVALFVFGMLFAAFIFPFLATRLGSLKARGGVWSKVIPQSMTRSA